MNESNYALNESMNALNALNNNQSRAISFADAWHVG